MRPEKKTNVPPMRSILFLDLAYTRILRSMKSTKNAHGLKLSRPARTNVKTGNAIFVVSIAPNTGSVIILSVRSVEVCCFFETSSLGVGGLPTSLSASETFFIGGDWGMVALNSGALSREGI